jgi:hypothetical protein
VIKSETVKDCLAKLKQKFAAIDVDFSQSIQYENSGSHTASFSHNEVIEDHDSVQLEVANDSFGLVETEGAEGAEIHAPAGPPPGH